MVSLLIGRKGRQVASLMSETNTKIFAVVPVKQVQYRPVRIDGHPRHVKMAVKTVVKLVERLLWKLQSVDYHPRPDLDQGAPIKAKLVLRDEYIPTILGKEGSFITALSKLYRVKLVVYKNKKIRSVENDESIMVELWLTLRR